MARRIATYEDVLKAPDYVVAEVVAGELHVSPRPGGPHAMAASILGVEPLEQVLEVWRNESGKWLQIAVHAGDEKVRAEPFDAIELDLSALWADVKLREPR